MIQCRTEVKKHGPTRTHDILLSLFLLDGQSVILWATFQMWNHSVTTKILRHVLEFAFYMGENFGSCHVHNGLQTWELALEQQQQQRFWAGLGMKGGDSVSSQFPYTLSIQV